jgi:exodeoxyribonuclease-3
MRIATWNVNSIKQRMDNLTAWLAERQPDIVCLQETKCVDDIFPSEPLEALGYNVAVHGQKAFNGVAVLSKFPLDEVTARLPGDSADDHARFMETVVSTAAHPSISPMAIRRKPRNIHTKSGGWSD